jgi:hypothetical protein
VTALGVFRRRLRFDRDFFTRTIRQRKKFQLTSDLLRITHFHFCSSLTRLFGGVLEKQLQSGICTRFAITPVILNCMIFRRVAGGWRPLAQVPIALAPRQSVRDCRNHPRIAAQVLPALRRLDTQSAALGLVASGCSTHPPELMIPSLFGSSIMQSQSIA